MKRSPQAAATRHAILQAAQECFAARGLAATTTREIARTAGVTQPLLHHYFGSKDALFDEVLEAVIEDYVAAQSEQWERPVDDLGFFTAGLTVLFQWLGDNPSLSRLVMWARLEGKSGVRESMRAVFESVRQRLEHAQLEGVLREGVDVDLALVMIDALFKGFWDRQQEYAGYPIDAQNLPERFLAQSLRTLFLGWLAPEVAQQLLPALTSE